MENKNVLYISYDGMTDPLGQSQVIPYIEGLYAKGYNFSLISCEKPDRFEKYSELIRDKLSKSSIEWYPLPYHKNPPVASTLYDYYKVKSLAVKLHKEKKFSLVHCRSYISSMVGLHLKKKYNVPFVFDMRGFWADERVDGGLWNLSNPLYKGIYNYFKKQEYQFLAHAAAVVSLTEAAKKEMLHWEVCKTYKTPIHVIPCSADFNLFQPVSQEAKNSARVSLGIKTDSKVVGYLGSIGTWYMLDEMLDFFKEFLKKFPGARFLFLTPDSEEYIRTCATEKSIPSECIVVKFAQREEIVRNIGAMDLSIFFIKPTYSKISSSPTKLGELLAMGIPVVCNPKVGDVEEIIATTHGGTVIYSFSPSEYQKAISNIDGIINQRKDEIRARAMGYYNLSLAVERYWKIYKSIL